MEAHFFSLSSALSRLNLQLSFELKNTQAIRAQVKRDQKVIDLTTSMVSVYTFVDAIQDVPQKIDVLSNTIDSIFKQTIECILFLREYTGKGFGGEGHHHVTDHVLTGRLKVDFSPT